MVGYFDVVAIASSAGGFEPIIEVISGIPADFPASVIVIRHLSPGVESHLAEILSRYTPLEKAGFILERPTGSYSIYYHPQTRRKAVVPIHSKDVPKGTLRKLSKEAGISKEELADLL